MFYCEGRASQGIPLPRRYTDATQPCPAPPHPAAPDSSVSILLSSKVEFMDSIHSVSTGPSNRIHLWSGLSSLRGQEWQMRCANHPSTDPTGLHTRQMLRPTQRPPPSSPCPSCYLHLHASRMMRASTPSRHSCVAASKEPYNSSTLNASGLMTWTCTCAGGGQHDARLR